MIPQIDQDFQKKAKQENANKKDVRPCNRFEENICTKERKSISVIKKREKRSV